METFAESRSGFSATRRANGWIIAELTPDTAENRLVSVVPQGSLWTDGRRAVVVAIAEVHGSDANAIAGRLRALEAAATAVRTPECQAGAGDSRAAIAMHKRLMDAALQFGRQNDRQTAPIEGSLAAAIVCWPELFYVQFGEINGWLCHNGQLRPIIAACESRLGGGRQSNAHAAMAAKAVSEASMPGAAGFCERNNLLIAQVPLAFGDTLLIGTPTLAAGLTELQIARALRQNGSATVACRELLEAAARQPRPDDLCILATRFHSTSWNGV